MSNETHTSNGIPSATVKGGGFGDHHFKKPGDGEKLINMVSASGYVSEEAFKQKEDTPTSQLNRNDNAKKKVKNKHYRNGQRPSFKGGK